MRRPIKVAVTAAVATVFSILAPAVAGAGPAVNAERWALLIGISDYHPPTVKTVGSANDARDMQAILIRQGVPEDHIRTLIDGAATADAIRAGMDWLVANSRPDTFSMAHYSGHTKQMESGFDDGDAEDWDEYLWSVDNEFISDGEFAGRMRELRGHAWINVSNCEAAGFDDNLSSPTRLFTAASQEDEKGYERPDTGRSIFTGLMTEAFSRRIGDTDRDKVVSIQEAFAYAADNAPRLSVNGEYGQQTPHMAGGDGTQWRLGPAVAEAKPPQQGSLIPPGLLPPEVLRLIPPGLVPPGILPPVTPQTP